MQNHQKSGTTKKSSTYLGRWDMWEKKIYQLLIIIILYIEEGLPGPELGVVGGAGVVDVEGVPPAPILGGGGGGRFKDLAVLEPFSEL